MSEPTHEGNVEGKGRKENRGPSVLRSAMVPAICPSRHITTQLCATGQVKGGPVHIRQGLASSESQSLYLHVPEKVRNNLWTFGDTVKGLHSS
jgi:hypothetical protein